MRRASTRFLRGLLPTRRMPLATKHTCSGTSIGELGIVLPSTQQASGSNCRSISDQHSYLTRKSTTAGPKRWLRGLRQALMPPSRDATVLYLVRSWGYGLAGSSIWNPLPTFRDCGSVSRRYQY
ncbi:hypothetical protein VTO73DRAFT_5996 [Trametes versicolor]